MDYLNIYLTEYEMHGITYCGLRIEATSWAEAEKIIRNNTGYPPGLRVVGQFIEEISGAWVDELANYFKVIQN